MLNSLGLFLTILLLLVLIAVPVVNHARRGNHARTCTDNLADLLAAKERYILAKELKPGAAVGMDDLLQATPKLRENRPVCPDGGEYHLNPAGELPSCSKAALGHVLPMAGKTRQSDPAGVLAPEPASTGK